MVDEAVPIIFLAPSGYSMTSIQITDLIDADSLIFKQNSCLLFYYCTLHLHYACLSELTPRTFY